MKGGSMTKILLETVFIIAAIQNESINPGVKSILQLFRRSIRYYKIKKLFTVKVKPLRHE